MTRNEEKLSKHKSELIIYSDFIVLATIQMNVQELQTEDTVGFFSTSQLNILGHVIQITVKKRFAKRSTIPLQTSIKI